MRYSETSVTGVIEIDLDPIEDERGFFARSFADDEFAARGMDPHVLQCNISFNRERGTLRGLHLQRDPWGEAKLVRCTRGRLYDVALDLRPASATYLRWYGVELSADNRKMLYVPPGVAHGFQTLADATEVFYQMSQRYRAEAAGGVRWNDPAFGIQWPLPHPILSERDATYPDFAR